MDKEQRSSQKEPGDMTPGKSIGKVGVTVNDTRPIIYVWRAISNVTPLPREKLQTINLQYATATSGWKHKTHSSEGEDGGCARLFVSFAHANLATCYDLFLTPKCLSPSPFLSLPPFLSFLLRMHAHCVLCGSVVCVCVRVCGVCVCVCSARTHGYVRACGGYSRMSRAFLYPSLTWEGVSR